VERRRLDHWEVLAWVLPGVAILIAATATVDLAYLIEIGDRMIGSGAIIRRDVLTYTVAGAPWTNQPWGASIVLSGIHSAVGWKGLVVSRAIIVSVCVGATYRRTRRAGADPIVAGCLVMGGFVCVAALPGALALRPQLLVAPLFVLTCWLLDPPRRSSAAVWAIVPVAIVWANLHGSFVLVPLLVAIAAIGELVARRPSAWRLVALFALTCAAPIVSPWGTATYAYVVEVTTSPIVRAIDEWRPIMTRWPAGVAFAAACVGLAAILWRRAVRPVPLEPLLAIAVFTVLVLVSGRNVVWWGFVVPPAAGIVLAGWRVPTQIGSRPRLVVVGVLVALLAMGVLRVAAAPRGETLLADVPTDLTSSLADRVDDGRIFAADFAGWFEYALPGTPMFVDPRVELFPSSVWDDFFAVATAAPGWGDVLARWDVTTVVVDPTVHPDLDRALKASGDWAMDYRDDRGAIFVRAGP